MNSEKLISIFKALSDPTRLQIVGMLGKSRLCACKILEKFNMTQPTLSYHMKILSDCDLVTVDKDWKWCYYTLNQLSFCKLKEFFDNIIEENKNDLH